jgi:4-aminobutyrate aminotransferase-like enzyme
LEGKVLLRCDPNWIAFAPPLIIEKNEIDTMMKVFDESLGEVLAMANSAKTVNPISKS